MKLSLQILKQNLNPATLAAMRALAASFRVIGSLQPVVSHSSDPQGARNPFFT